MEVTEQLETLSVAGEAEGREAAENVSPPSEEVPAAGQAASPGRGGAGGAAAGGLLQAAEAAPYEAAPDGGPSDAPATGASRPGDRPACSGNRAWPGGPPLLETAVAGGGQPPGAEQSEERIQDSGAAAEGEAPPGPDLRPEQGLPPPSGPSRPSACPGSPGGPGEGPAGARLSSAGTEEPGGRVDRSPCDVPAVEEEASMDEGGTACAQSESDTDTDSSSSVSSPSSCSPVVSEEDNQQYKNDANLHTVGKNDELSEKSLPVEDLTVVLPESVQLMPFGKISSIIENLVIVESLKGLPPVNEDSVLFKQDHCSIGKVFEVFGPVSRPFYALQFNSPEHIEAKGIKMHDDVYFAPSVESFTQYIFPEKLKQDKGSDASWKNDGEPPPEALDFSDDEKEKAAKQQKKSQNLRRKKFRSQESNVNGIHYQPRGHYPSNYSSGPFREELNPSFSRGVFPHSPIRPHSYRWQAKPPQHYRPAYTEFQKPSAFFQHQRRGNPGRQQYSFPPPSFGTVSNEANNFPPPPPNWEWPQECVQNSYDPLLSLLSLPPPPPPPLPPASTAPPNNTNPL